MWTTMRHIVNQPAVLHSATTEGTAAASTSIIPNNIFRLWRGIPTILVGCVPAHALYFSSYEAVKYYGKRSDGTTSPGWGALAGAAAVLGHDIIMTPLDTIKQRLQLDNELQGIPIPSPRMTKQKPSHAKKQLKKTKDPTEVAQYLSSWKHRAAGTNWKFNKNTQSWIVRHMYEADKLNKQVFEMCLEYLGSINDAAKVRVLEDAKQRARRYKEYEATTGTSNHSNKGTTATIQSTKQETMHSKVNLHAITEEDDEKRWKKLDDHDKRKEYKRARKILEILIQEE